jgi:hypothetical protein
LLLIILRAVIYSPEHSTFPEAFMVQARWMLAMACSLAIFLSCNREDKPKQEEAPPRIFVAEVGRAPAPHSHANSVDGEDAEARDPERRINLDLMKTLQQACPDLPVTLDEASGDFTILVEKVAAEGPEPNRYRVAAFDPEKDMIYNDSPPSLEKGIANACTAIRASHKASEKAR